MAVIWTDSTTGLAAAALNKMMAGDGYTNGAYATLAYRIYYDGASWVVDTSYGTKQSAADVSVAWNAGDNRLDIDLSGLDNPFNGTPAVIVQAEAPAAHATGPRYNVYARATGPNDILVRFRDGANAAFATSESTSMIFDIFICGSIY